MWSWIYRIIAAALAAMGAGLLDRVLGAAKAKAQALALSYGEDLRVAAGLALVLLISAALILIGPAARPRSRR
ncbi:MAG: hypothetical protein JO127_05035 [Caulobacteraceae bacterium]|nr:hypothetical protein [Caulobacteraceae bacterium]